MSEKNLGCFVSRSLLSGAVKYRLSALYAGGLLFGTVPYSALQLANQRTGRQDRSSQRGVRDPEKEKERGDDHYPRLELKDRIKGCCGGHNMTLWLDLRRGQRQFWVGWSG